MKILAVSSFYPAPTDDGRKVRVQWLLSALVGLGEVELACPAASRGPGWPALPAECSPPVRSFPSRRHSAPGRWLLAVTTATPPWVLESRSPDLVAYLHTRAKEVDLVFFLDDAAGHYARHVSSGVTTVHDKHAVLTWLVDEAPTIGQPAVAYRLRHRVVRWMTYRFERRCVASATHVTVSSDDDAIRLRDVLGRRADEVVPSGVVISGQLPDAAARLSGPQVRRRIGFLGSLRMSPNTAGLLRYLASEADTLTARRIELDVAGAPPDDFTVLPQRPSIHYRGFVDDLHEWLAGIDVVIVPLWSGSGVKIKTITALAAGVPIVSTAIGVEGIPLVAGVHYREAETPRGITDAAEDLLNNPDRARVMAESARTTLRDCVSVARVEESIRSLLTPE